MATEVALATLLLIAAGLFLRSFNGSRALDPGFRRDGVLLAAYDFTGRSIDDAAARDFARRLVERVRTIPGVASAAIATSVPLDIHGLPARSISVEGRAVSEAAPRVALTNTVTDGYFKTLGIPFVAGRDFAVLADADAPPQAVVNEEFVHRFIATAPRSAVASRRAAGRS